MALDQIIFDGGSATIEGATDKQIRRLLNTIPQSANPSTYPDQTRRGSSPTSYYLVSWPMMARHGRIPTRC
ncbi:MAG: hypothetical protein ACI88C_003412 [Acidimicrobiales bacterium]|jgi:hypothetical protein